MKRKSIFNAREKIQMWILNKCGTIYELVTGKTEYEISFTLFKRKYGIEKRWVDGKGEMNHETEIYNNRV